MAACITEGDLAAAQSALEELQTALDQARAVHDAKIQAAEAAQAQEVERLVAAAQEAQGADDDDDENAVEKIRNRPVALHLTYNGHGFSVRSPLLRCGHNRPIHLSL